jgi:hypothetical protein
MSNVSQGLPKFRPVAWERSSMSSWVWSMWTMAKGLSPCRGVALVSSKIVGSVEYAAFAP